VRSVARAVIVMEMVGLSRVHRERNRALVVALALLATLALAFLQPAQAKGKAGSVTVQVPLFQPMPPPARPLELRGWAPFAAAPSASFVRGRAAARNQPFVRNCESSVYGDLGAQWLKNAVRAGPLTFIGARRNGLVARRGASSHKLLIVVEPRRAVTVTVAKRARGLASLRYDPAKFHLRNPRIWDGEVAVTFIACAKPNGSAPWERGTQFNGELVVYGPRCVPLEISVGFQAQKIRRTLSFGTGSCRRQTSN
jgi:hypothetical protein